MVVLLGWGLPKWCPGVSVCAYTKPQKDDGGAKAVTVAALDG
jgi:hypothetical protein